ncbi:hypothetical protein JRQ81_013293 [Phrynocephalus forsythii]|uniref:Uncharacterized protein n=1 Tax=Phrynocephalus forsythii TaxID=171643 RepID=A0A9Q0XZW4_9SAUR|nr:hypothetical protein JRQ81_013293 [Phrynocephalus forsythii]
MPSSPPTGNVCFQPCLQEADCCLIEATLVCGSAEEAGEKPQGPNGTERNASQTCFSDIFVQSGGSLMKGPKKMVRKKNTILGSHDLSLGREIPVVVHPLHAAFSLQPSKIFSRKAALLLGIPIDQKRGNDGMKTALPPLEKQLIFENWPF